ncbi:MAG TPA: helix-turn-helix domain-containing protein [Candidatus Moranbacteria bacterium]|nr:helix-turn-helix domain-containing protein [Candidatus Moranbacteria bacterium]
MISFVKKKVKAQTLGEKLKEIRTESKISLDEIARVTKVRKKYLECLESGCYEQLPPDVYVKGFLKSYSSYLGLSEKDVLKLYKKEVGIQDNLKKIDLISKTKPPKFFLPTLTITPKITAGAISLILILLGGSYFYREISRFSATPYLVLTQPLGDVTVQADTLDMIGTSEQGSQVFLNGQPIAVNESGGFHETINLRQGINELEVKSINHFGNESTKKIKVAAEFEDKLAIKNSAENQGEEKVMGEQVSQEGIFRLEIKTQDEPVWVAVKVDDSGNQSSTMLPGSTQIFEASEKIAVTSGKANKTLVRKNEEDWKILGDSPGVARDVLFEFDEKN